VIAETAMNSAAAATAEARLHAVTLQQQAPVFGSPVPPKSNKKSSQKSPKQSKGNQSSAASTESADLDLADAAATLAELEVLEKTAAGALSSAQAAHATAQQLVANELAAHQSALPDSATSTKNGAATVAVVRAVTSREVTAWGKVVQDGPVDDAAPDLWSTITFEAVGAPQTDGTFGIGLLGHALCMLGPNRGGARDDESELLDELMVAVTPLALLSGLPAATKPKRVLQFVASILNSSLRVSEPFRQLIFLPPDSIKELAYLAQWNSTKVETRERAVLERSVQAAARLGLKGLQRLLDGVPAPGAALRTALQCSGNTNEISEATLVALDPRLLPLGSLLEQPAGDESMRWLRAFSRTTRPGWRLIARATQLPGVPGTPRAGAAARPSRRRGTPANWQN